eukprot:291840-Pyramimonas_sp.AAC.1
MVRIEPSHIVSGLERSGTGVGTVIFTTRSLYPDAMCHLRKEKPSHLSGPCFETPDVGNNICLFKRPPRCVLGKGKNDEIPPRGVSASFYI